MLAGAMQAGAIMGDGMDGRLVLGDLEGAVLDHLWEVREGTPISVHEAVGQPRGIRPNTVQSTLRRLFDKGLLERQKVSHSYVYRPAVARRELQGRLLEGLVSRWGDGDGSTLMAAFVELTERAGEDRLRALERLVAERLDERDAGC